MEAAEPTVDAQPTAEPSGDKRSARREWYPARVANPLADLPHDAPWEAYALVLAAGGAPSPPPPGIPESLAVIAAAAGRLELVVESDEPYPRSGRWVFGALEPLDDYWLAVFRDAKVAGELRFVASNESQPAALIVAWTPGDRDAIVYDLWQHPHDEPTIERVGALRDLLADVIQAVVFSEPAEWRVTVAPVVRDALRALLVAAGDAREALRAERRERVAAIEASIGAAGSDDAETMQQWEHAAAELARVEHMPLLWHRLGDPVDE